MPIACVINGGIVVNRIVVSDDYDVAALLPTINCEYAVMNDEAQIGWDYDPATKTFSAPSVIEEDQQTEEPQL